MTWESGKQNGEIAVHRLWKNRGSEITTKYSVRYRTNVLYKCTERANAVKYYYNLDILIYFKM